MNGQLFLIFCNFSDASTQVGRTLHGIGQDSQLCANRILISEVLQYVIAQMNEISFEPETPLLRS